MKSGIYAITHVESRKGYVGSSVYIPRRWAMHLRALSQGIHHSWRLQNAWNKYGAAAFEFTVLEYVGRAELIAREQFWIDALSAYAGGYNILPKAGSGIGRVITAQTLANMRAASAKRRGRPRSVEIRAKISATQAGKPRNPASIAKMAATKKGKPMSAEAVARSAASRTGKKLSSEAIAKRTATRNGMRHTVEAKAKMSATRKGRAIAPETRTKISAALTGKPKSAETRARMTEAQRARAMVLKQVNQSPPQ